jgi:YVTN family beta-propeller protein
MIGYVDIHPSVSLEPFSHKNYGPPEANVFYTIEVTNRTGRDESFNLSMTDNSWPTELSIYNSSVIPDGNSIKFTINVEIPAAALPGEIDTATITITSISDPNITDTAIITTTASLEEGLIAYYPFNGNANDESGMGNHGTVHGATLTTDRFGNLNSAYSFNGVDDYIRIDNTSTFDFLSGGFTLVAWVNFTQDNSDNGIIAKHDCGYFNGYYLGVLNNSFDFYVTSDPRLLTSETYKDGKWHFVVGVYDDVNQYLYVDSVFKTSQPRSHINPIDLDISIGRMREYCGYFNGMIDDVRIYNRALSEGEIQELFYEGLTGPVITPPTQTDSGEAGTTITYTFLLANYTGTTDSFDLFVSGDLWPTSLSIENTGIIFDGESATFTVNVDIPSSALPGDTDTAMITATSVTDHAITDIATVTTTANSGEYAYVTISPNDYIALIDRVTNQLIGTINVEDWDSSWPWRIAIEPQGRYAYVSCRDSDNIVVIDTESNSVTTTISDTALYRPHGISFTSDSAYAFVGSKSNSQVVVVDTNAQAVVKTIAVSSPPMSIAISPTEIYAYATSRYDNSLAVIDTENMTVIDTISVGSDPWDVVISPDGERIYVTNRGDNSISIIDAATHTVIETLVHIGGRPHGLDISPDGSYLYVAGGDFGNVYIIDTSSIQVVANLGIWPGEFDHTWEIAVSPEGDFVYVTNSKDSYSRQVGVIDTSTNTVIATVQMPDTNGDGYPDWGARGIAICSLSDLYPIQPEQKDQEPQRKTITHIYPPLLLNLQKQYWLSLYQQPFIKHVFPVEELTTTLSWDWYLREQQARYQPLYIQLWGYPLDSSNHNI